MKKKNGNNGDSKKKERHIVSWSQEEDDVLREQIRVYGTENWAIIASKFKDKTTRQCRRRWYTYLNSDFKNGGWSLEEDMLLCEAQRIIGNRWTEIAKVVSGRTDNAVKNRFTTLCKKKAKYEAIAKQNKNPFLNSRSKRMLLFPDGFGRETAAENGEPAKKIRRSNILDLTTNANYIDRSHKCELVHNLTGSNDLMTEIHVINVKEIENDGKTNKALLNLQNSQQKRAFIKKDDPKISSLMQQAELLTSLAQKVNADNTEQGMENAWRVLQDFLNNSKANDIFGYGLPDIGFEVGDVKDFLEDVPSSNEDSQASWRQPYLHDSPASSEYSTGSTIIQHPVSDERQQTQSETQSLQTQDMSELESIHIEKSELQSIHIEKQNHTLVEILSPCHGQTEPHGVVPVSGEEEFSYPLHVTPLFKSLAAGIPSPQFSESVRILKCQLDQAAAAVSLGGREELLA